MLFHGPPGVGKTMIAQRVPGLLLHARIRNPQILQGASANREAGRIFDEGTAARKHSEDYTGTTVVLATVLFLVALSPGFRSRRVWFALLFLTGVVQHDETSGDSRALRRCPGLERPVH